MSATTTMIPPPPGSRASAMPAAAAASHDGATPPPAAILRGTGRGLEIIVAERATIDEICAALLARLEASPAFFVGSDVTLRLNGVKLPVGALTRIETLAARFGIRVAEVRAGAIVASSATTSSAPCAPAADPPGTARLHVGPVRSGVILQVPGDLVVVGDVNPGAEIRARGSITVMGSLRGLAHAGHGEAGNGAYIVALRLDAPQVRIGQLIARAGDGDGAARGAEIAYATGGKIIVEGYQGRLPGGLASPAARR